MISLFFKFFIYQMMKLGDNMDKIDWCQLPNDSIAIKTLKENQKKINWRTLSFDYNYEKMRNSNLDLKEEIIAKALHPKRIFKLIEEYGEEEIYDIYFDD